MSTMMQDNDVIPVDDGKTAELTVEILDKVITGMSKIEQKTETNEKDKQAIKEFKRNLIEAKENKDYGKRLITAMLSFPLLAFIGAWEKEE